MSRENSTERVASAMRLETMQGQIDEDRRPEKKNEYKPNVLGILVWESPHIDVLKNDKHKNYIEDESNKAEGHKNTESPVFWKQKKGEDEKKNETECKN